MTANPMAWEGSVNPRVSIISIILNIFHAYFMMFLPSIELIFYRVLISQTRSLQKAQDCLLPMGVTSENVAQRYGVTREEQDTASVSLFMDIFKKSSFQKYYIVPHSFFQ